VAAFSFLLALEIAIFGFLPGVNNLNMLQIIDWSILGFATIILIISIIAGFVHDGEKQVNSALAQTKKTL